MQTLCPLCLCGQSPLFADLDTPLFLAHEPFRGGLRYDRGRIDLAPITLGHGVTLTEGAPF